jgi:uncharacterized protein YegP (UPF0339 family)
VEGCIQIRGSWCVQLCGHDGGLLLRSLELDSEAACRQIVGRIRLSATMPERYESRDSIRGGHYFVLRGDTGDVLAMSPIHASRDSCDRAILAVRESAIRALAIAAMR